MFMCGCVCVRMQMPAICGRASEYEHKSKMKIYNLERKREKWK